ncbi:DUF2769 domain-containing protein [Candidatus Parcubacteria bacterium]|nr:DUF2769 domain-containing protein [Candidatus Parcubacteria bacterium]
MKVANTKENLMKCICGNCPTYNECMKEKMEGLFCARGKATCALEKKGCICGECPVQSENDLDGMYYCNAGEAE